MRIIDTHQHLWDLDRFRLPWTADEPRLAQSFLMRDYLTAAAGLNIRQTVYMEVDLAAEQQWAEAQFAAELCAATDNPMTAAVVSGQPGEAGFSDYLDRLRELPAVRGLRRVLHTPASPPGHCLEPPFLEDVRRLSERGLSFDVCIRREELHDAAALADACPDTRFILDHCGNADVRAPADAQAQWRRDLEAVARRPNVTCKVSGFIWTVRDEPWSVETLAPVVRHARDCFGPDRLLFGGDWPVCTLAVTLAQWVQALQAIVADWPEADQQKLFWRNAAEFYRLPSE